MPRPTLRSILQKLLPHRTPAPARPVIAEEQIEALAKLPEEEWQRRIRKINAHIETHRNRVALERLGHVVDEPIPEATKYVQ